MKIAVLDDWQTVAESIVDWAPVRRRVDELVFFHQPISGEAELVSALASFDIILTLRERTPFPAGLVAQLPKLRMLGITGPRARSIDVAALTARGVVVCNTRSDDEGEFPAEMALALMLAAARNVASGDAALRAGAFQAGLPLGLRLRGKVLELVGLGTIGGLMARYGHALGMQVTAWSANLDDARAAECGATKVTKEALFANSDVISIHLVLSDRSRGIVGTAELEAMKPGAILVNTSRGPLVDEAALIRVVEAGRITAALDVFDREPIAQDHPLIRARNTVLTPHLGFSVTPIFERFFLDQIENVLAFLDGNPIRRMKA